MKSLMEASIDMRSLERQLTAKAKVYGENQEQAIRRWGVQVCRELAVSTQAHGKTAKKQKLAITKDARNVLFTHTGRAKPSRTGRSMVYSDNGKSRSVESSRYLSSEAEVIKWIDRHRTSANKRTRRLPPERKAVCSEAIFRRAINKKHKEFSGSAKDGWLDAGDSISRRQKGKSPAKIGLGFMKWARKPSKLGKSKVGTRAFKTFGELVNFLAYTRKKYVLKGSDKKQAVRSGLYKTIKWYRRATAAESKKKR